MAKKLYGAAAKAHAKKAGRKAPVAKKAKTRAKAKSTGALIQHKAYSYKNSKGKMVHVAAHTEHRRA